MPNYPNVDIALPKHVPGETDDEPVEDLKEEDEAETKAKPKEAAHAWDEVDCHHPLDSLVLYI